MILDKIVAHKKQEVKIQKSLMPLRTLMEVIPSLPKTKAFAEALEGSAISLIAEIKKGSPSKGVIRNDFAPLDIAREYTKYGAKAISVLTDEKFFFGHREYLRSVRGVTTLPLLRKDFIIDPWQVYESRVLGADAILLISSILDDQLLLELKGLAGELGLECLVEVHTEEELEMALKIPELKLVGINNRDLCTFQTNLQTTLRLMEILHNASRLKPGTGDSELKVISESGINTRADIVLLENHGVDGVLIGEALMREKDIKTKISELLGKEGVA